MKAKGRNAKLEKLTKNEMSKISGGAGHTKMTIIIDGIPTVIWV